MKTTTFMYAYWVTAATATLAAISFIMLALSLHHSTRSAAGHHNTAGSGGGGTSLGMHDGDG